MPLDLLLLETDAPYFVPRTLQRKVSLPGDVVHVAAQVAELKGVTVQEVLRANLASVQHVYGVKPSGKVKEEQGQALEQLDENQNVKSCELVDGGETVAVNSSKCSSPEMETIVASSISLELAAGVARVLQHHKVQEVILGVVRKLRLQRDVEIVRARLIGQS